MNHEPEKTDGAGPSGASSSGSAAGTTSAEKPKPTDISHLIKRKKPDTDGTEVDASPAKKQATGE